MYIANELTYANHFSKILYNATLFLEKDSVGRTSFLIFWTPNNRTMPWQIYDSLLFYEMQNNVKNLFTYALKPTATLFICPTLTKVKQS